MAYSPPFINPSDMGLDHITGTNSTDMVFAVLEFWRGVGVEGHWAITTIVFGFIPIILGFMVFMRYQQFTPTILTTIMGFMFIMGLEIFYYGRIGILVNRVVSVGFTVILTIMLAKTMSSITGGDKH
jgi:hypothetical protein